MQFEEMETALLRIVEPVAARHGVEVVEVRYFRTGPAAVIKILVDRRGGGIGLDECAAMNREVGDILEVQGTLEGSYTLEVSSPGLDRPLVTREDFARCMNRAVTVYLKDVFEGLREFTGTIHAVEEDAVQFEKDGVLMRVPLSVINKAKQVI